MRDSAFWKATALLFIAALFYVGHGLTANEWPAHTAIAQPPKKVQSDVILSANWEQLPSPLGAKAFRLKVKGGWLIRYERNSIQENKSTFSNTHGIGIGLTFFPDPDHDWDGTGL